MNKQLWKSWRLLDTAVNSSFLNMAIDEAILDAHQEGLVPPTLRVYRWSRSTLSLGYFQTVEAEIDVEACAELQIDVVRRLTGGRAVLHHDEMTYSIVVSEEYGFPRSIPGSYRILSQGLIAAYRMLGVKTGLARSPKEASTAACFSASGLADLTCQGCKIAGSAQVRRGDTLLQHGSLPMTLSAEMLFSALKFSSDTLRARALAAFKRKVTCISTVLGHRVGWQEIKQALARGFQEALDIQLCEDGLTSKEIRHSQKLAQEKYSTPAWNYKR